jgi:hypothetical protein
MTPETSLSGSISTRPYTVVRARRLRIRHLRPGDGFIEQVGANQRVNQAGLPEGGLKFTRTQRLFYAANLKLAQSGADPYALLARLGRLSPTTARIARPAQTSLDRQPRIMKRKIAVAVIALVLMATMARHVHLGPSTMAGFFRTRMASVDAYWVALRAKPADQPVVLANNDMQPVVEETAAALPQAAGPGDTQTPAPQQATTGNTYGSGYRIQGMGNILPMPSYEPGPLPPGMLPYQPAGGPIGLPTHPAFTEPDDGSENGAQPEDTVTLLTAHPAVAVAPKPKRKEASSEERETRKPASRSSAPLKVAVHPAHTTPQMVAQTAVPAQQPAAQLQAPAPADPSQQSQATADNDVVLLGQKAPGAQDDQGAASDGGGGQTNTAVREVQADAGDQSQAPQSGASNDQPQHPSFHVVTHTDNSVVVQVNGQVKQISIGQSLPDGTKLLRVDHSGGGFTTSRGNYAAY